MKSRNIKSYSLKNLYSFLILGSVSLIAISVSGCGKAAFRPIATTSSVQASGSYTIIPKVDIILAEDDTGSMNESFDAISSQVPEFLSNLENSGWDFHFTVTPLTQKRVLTEAMASKHDGNWNTLGQWKKPFPGASLDLPGFLSSSIFRTNENFTSFISDRDINNDLMGKEPGLDTIYKALYDPDMIDTHFLRKDALLAIVVIGNGEDTSKVNLCTRWDGVFVPCNDGSYEDSLNLYKNYYEALKSNSALAKFYAAVSTTTNSSCLGTRAWKGNRYMEMAQKMGGKVFDVCSTPISEVLNGIKTELKTQKGSLRTKYIFLAEEPDVSSIMITKYPEGNEDQATNLSQDDENGWTYEGYLENVYAIDLPAPLNMSSGYAIELHGDGKIFGVDTIRIDYKPTGSSSAAE